MTAFATSGSVSGRRVLGRYELLLPIASGGMATVWAARLRGSRGFQKIVAIKTIRTEVAVDPEFGDMLLDEASLASRIRHPQVVEILDLGDQDGVPYIVMEWIDGEPLHVLIKEAMDAEPVTGGVPLPICVRIGTQLCAGLHAAHELRDDNDRLVGLVHRDVSPQNVLVTWDGVAKLVDFGIAKAAGRSVGQTVAGRIKGKTAYLAPEQILGEPVDRRTDIFATGTLLYSMSTGKHPFRGNSDVDTLGNVLSEKPPARPGKIVAGFPPQFEKVIMTALEKEPSRRYQTANEMLRELDRALPANKRISTDEEVACYVRGLLGPRFEDKRSRIKDALRRADECLADDARRSFTTETSEALLPDKPLPTGVRVVDRNRFTQAASSGKDDAPASDADVAPSGVVGRVVPRTAACETIPAAPRARAASSDSYDDTVVPPTPQVPRLDDTAVPSTEPAPRLQEKAVPDTLPAPPDEQKEAARPEPSPDPAPTASDPDLSAEHSTARPGRRRQLVVGIAVAFVLAGIASIALVRRNASSPAAEATRPDSPSAVLTAALPTASAPAPSTSPSTDSMSETAASSGPASLPAESASANAPAPSVSATPKSTATVSTTAPTAHPKPKPKTYKPTTI